MKSSTGKVRAGSAGRILIVSFVLAAGLVGLGYRLFVLQVVNAAELSKRAKSQQEKSVWLQGERGTIYDRKGRVLATNVDVPSVYAIPALLRNHREAALQLSRVLDADPEILSRKMIGHKNFVWIERKVSPAVSRRVRESGIQGIGLLNESHRFYPKRYLMGHLLGFAGVDNQGLEGIELKYDQLLRGEKGWVVIERDAFGRSIFPKGLNYVGPSRGKDLVLTIDEGIQHVVERELDAVMNETMADGSSAIIMDPRTGEILAMAIRPEFNPNGLDRKDPGQWRNRAITDPYEPGSTMKIITAAAALQERVTSPSDVLYCEDGRMVLGGGAIRDHEKQGYLTFRQVIQKSSNICTVKVAMRIGNQRLYRYLREFGFGEKTGIDLVGESPGLLRDPDSWSLRSLASISIGQEFAATPIQVISAVSAIANGGWLVRPRLVSEVRDSAGNVIDTFLPEIRRQVVSRETADEVMRILEGVVSEDGTGGKAAIPGYRVAGKTGTAQKIDPVTKRYSIRETVSSFVGIVPAGDPRIVVLVVVDNPKGVAWGGSVAAPVFKNIAKQVLRYLGVPPQTQERVMVTMAQ